MHASCPSCRTPVLGPRLPDACPVCGADLRGLPAPAGAGPSVPDRARPTGSPGAEPTPFLVLSSAEGLSAELPLEPFSGIGRHTDNAVVLADREVSKRHAIIERTGDGWFLRDLGSSNGTFVNGRRVTELRLREGDEIRVGNSSLVFRTGAAPAAAPVPRQVTVVQSPGMTQVLASAAPRAAEEAQEFLPASRIEDLGQLRSDYERLRIAWRFQEEGGLVTDQDTLFLRILKLSLEWLPADNAVILVPEGPAGSGASAAPGEGTAEGGWRVVLAESRTEDAEIQVSQTLLEQVSSTCQGVLSHDAVTDQRFSAAVSMVSKGVRAVMAVPVVARGEIRALVYLDSRSRTSAFTPKDLEVLTNIAEQAAVALHNAELIQKIKHEEATRSQLERFLSPALVSQAARGELDLKKGGSVVQATILFSDIRGFTAMSEQATAEAVVRMLNEYFEDMVDVVFSHQGVLDKFIGDAVMALWGVPVAGEHDACRAVRAALDMQHRISAFNARRIAQGGRPIQVGIGVNTGECVVGNMGSSRRLEYTVIGDAVNLASRLCNVAGGDEILISESTMQACSDTFDLEALPAAQVKGKAKPVSVFRVIGERA